MDLLKRVEEDQEDLNELMKKHKALIAQVSPQSACLPHTLLRKFKLSRSPSLSQSSSDISQIRELQAELEEVKKQRHSLQEQVKMRC